MAVKLCSLLFPSLPSSLLFTSCVDDRAELVLCVDSIRFDEICATIDWMNEWTNTLRVWMNADQRLMTTGIDVTAHGAGGRA